MKKYGAGRGGEGDIKQEPVGVIWLGELGREVGMTLEERLRMVAEGVADRLDQVAELREVEFSAVEDMADWLRWNEPAVGLEFLADRLFDHGVPLTREEFEAIEACRVACRLPEGRRFSALLELVVP